MKKRSGRGRKKKLTKKELRQREQGFDLSCTSEKLPAYNALFDRNLRHHFENRGIQKQLHNVGLIDHEGRVLDLEKAKSKLFIIDQEFETAEKAERRARREDEELRRRVQKKRLEMIERAKIVDRLAKIKEDKRIRREIHQAAHPTLHSKRRPKKKPSPTTDAGASSSFFLTERGLDASSII